VHHQLQQARDVGLEWTAFSLGVGFGGHGGLQSPGLFSTGNEMARRAGKFKMFAVVSGRSSGDSNARMDTPLRPLIIHHFFEW
jgi:hypothetical protein